MRKNYLLLALMLLSFNLIGQDNFIEGKITKMNGEIIEG